MYTFLRSREGYESVDGVRSFEVVVKDHEIKVQPLDCWSTVAIEQAEWMFLKLSYD